MDLSIYDIIKGPIPSGKARKSNTQLQQLVLKVHMEANKPLIKEALEKLFNVKVDGIRVMIRKGKRRMVGRKSSFGSNEKRAIVTLKQGYNIGAFEQETMQGTQEQLPAHE